MDLDDGRLTTIATEHRGIIKSIEYINDGNELATISRQTDSSVYFLNAESGEVPDAASSGMSCVAAISPFLKMVATWQQPVTMPVCVSGCLIVTAK